MARPERFRFVYDRTGSEPEAIVYPVKILRESSNDHYIKKVGTLGKRGSFADVLSVKLDLFHIQQKNFKRRK